MVEIFTKLLSKEDSVSDLFQTHSSLLPCNFEQFAVGQEQILNVIILNGKQGLLRDGEQGSRY